MNILGVVRNGGEALVETLTQITALRARLPASRVTLATNDNSDGTDRHLAQYAAQDPDVHVLTLDGLAARVTDRVERITFARNAVLDHAMEEETAHPFTLILDMDGPNMALQADQVLKAAARQTPHWDAVFANARPVYYDLYALRCPGWCDEDIWQKIRKTRKPLFGRKKWRRNLLRSVVYARQFDIPETGPLIPVDSAFAGAGLYRTEALQGLRYACHDPQGGLICEHVALHQQMRARGARLFIDPAFTTNAAMEHCGEGSGLPFPQHLNTSPSKTD